MNLVIHGVFCGFMLIQKLYLTRRITNNLKFMFTLARLFVPFRLARGYFYMIFPRASRKASEGVTSIYISMSIEKLMNNLDIHYQSGSWSPVHSLKISQFQ